MTVSRQQLIDFAAGDLTGADADRVERHLATSLEAAAAVARYRAVAALRAGDDSVAPGSAVVARAKAIFQAASQPTADWVSRLREVIAAIVWDSRLQPAAVRRAGTHDFQIAAEAEGLHLDLGFTRLAEGGGTRWRLAGQLTPNSETECTAELREASADETVPVWVDAHGVLAAEVPSGEWRLVVRHGEAAVVVQSIVLP